MASVNPGGYTPSRTISAATTNATLVKAAPGKLGGWYMTNTGAAPAYVKFYDSATIPTAGSGTPVLTLMLPGNTLGAGANNQGAFGVNFANGIGFTITGAAADNDTTAVGAAAVIVNLLYQ